MAAYTVQPVPNESATAYNMETEQSPQLHLFFSPPSELLYSLHALPTLLLTLFSSVDPWEILFLML
jgi:hypothetical protein